MSIYARCCGKDFKSTKRKCISCGKSFTKYVVKVKDSVTGRWKTKTVSDLKLARDIEVKYKTEIIEGNVFDKRKVGEINFEKYLKYAKVHKITWKTDRSRWNNHVDGKDFLSKKGIENILSTMRDNGYSECSIHHVLKLIRRVYNWNIQNDLYYKANPCISIDTPSYDNRVTDYLTDKDIGSLLSDLEKWDNHKAVRVILFALFTGRRK